MTDKKVLEKALKMACGMEYIGCGKCPLGLEHACFYSFGKNCGKDCAKGIADYFIRKAKAQIKEGR